MSSPRAKLPRAEMLHPREEDKARAVVFGLLREMERK
jgi:hypothetical protein